MAPEMTPEQRDVAYNILAWVGCGPPRSFFTQYEGREQHFGCLSVVVPRGKYAHSILKNIRNILPVGLVGFLGDMHSRYTEAVPEFLGEQSWGYTRYYYEVIIGAGDSQFDILRHAKTSDVDGGRSTEVIVDKLQRYDRLYGIRIDEADICGVTFEILTKTDNMTVLLQDLEEFCPGSTWARDIFENQFSFSFVSNEYRKRLGIGQS
jgi:hypothetical protein